MSAADAPGANQLRAFFERWQRLEEEKATIAEDLKELFAEAKGTGFDPKVMRVVFRCKAKEDAEGGADRADRQEFEATCELYRAALDGPRAHPARSARVEIIEEFDPETGEIKESGGVSSPTRTSLAAREADESAATNSPETATKSQPVATVHGSDANAGDGLAEPACAHDDAAANTKSAPTDFEPPAFLARQKTMADFRPNCLEPEACRSSSLSHCYTCRKAMEAAGHEVAA